MHSERTQGFAADPDFWKGEVFAYVGSIQNLKDLNVIWRGQVRLWRKFCDSEPFAPDVHFTAVSSCKTKCRNLLLDCFETHFLYLPRSRIGVSLA
jgi:hypothetical protein